MIKLNVYQNGDVLGDTGKIVAYEGSCYSDIINIVHPIYEGAEYFVEYKCQQTLMRDRLDSNNNVRIRIGKAGYLLCQFIATDIQTGDVLFRSNSWNLLIQKQMTVEPSHYPCPSHPTPHNIHHGCFPHQPAPNNSPNMDSYEAYYKLVTELRNEEDIRYRENQAIREDLMKIKDALNIADPTPSIIDANEVIKQGKYIALINSINFPTNDQEYFLIVNQYNNKIIQEAHEIDGDNIWYRSGMVSVDAIPYVGDWTPWAPMITRVAEI